MPYHDAQTAERQLMDYVQHGQWAQGLAAVEDWLRHEPWRTELLLRKAQLLRRLERFEPGLTAVRAYRQQKPLLLETAFIELEFLLELGRTLEALEVLGQLPVHLRMSAQGEFYRGRILLARQQTQAGLQVLWDAYTQELGFHRALLAWTTGAQKTHSLWNITRRLRRLQAEHAEVPVVAMSVGLALNQVAPGRGTPLVRQALERAPNDMPVLARRHQPLQGAPAVGTSTGEGADAYRQAIDHLLCGQITEAIEACYRASREDATWLSALTPFMADTLLQHYLRPEEARLLVEDALARDATNFRLHHAYTGIFLRLGFAEEAHSSAQCALTLAPEEERMPLLVQAAAARVLARDVDGAVKDLATAVARGSEARVLIASEPLFNQLSRDTRYRSLMAGYAVPPATPWQHLWRWVVGEA